MLHKVADAYKNPNVKPTPFLNFEDSAKGLKSKIPFDGKKMYFGKGNQIQTYDMFTGKVNDVCSIPESELAAKFNWFTMTQHE